MARTEQTGLFIAGLLVDDVSYQWPRVPYARTITELDLIVQGIAPAGANATFQLTLNGVGQTGNYTVPDGLKLGENPVDDLLVPANVFPGIKIVHAADSADIVAWLTSSVTPAEVSTDPWPLPTVADLRTHISDPEWESFTQDTLQLSGGDPVPALLQQSVDRIRNAVSRGGFVMGALGTVPRELLTHTIDFAKYKLFSRVASLKAYAEGMKPVADGIEKFLDDYVAAGKSSVSMPTTPLATGIMQTDGVQVVSRPTVRQLSRRTLNGLM